MSAFLFSAFRWGFELTNPPRSSLYLDILKEIATAGVTFEHKNALMTGVGKGSIGVEIVKGLLAGGAKVVVTTVSTFFFIFRPSTMGS